MIKTYLRHSTCFRDAKTGDNGARAHFRQLPVAPRISGKKIGNRNDRRKENNRHIHRPKL